MPDIDPTPLSPSARYAYFKARAEQLGWLSQCHAHPDTGSYIQARATHTLANVRVLERFDDLEREGVVRLRCEPDEDSTLDDYDPRPARGAHPEKIRAWEHRMRQIEQDGCWWYCAEYLDPATGCWEAADSLGGCYGNLDDADYGGDLKRSALHALDKARDDYASEQAFELNRRATYAGPTEATL